MGYLIGTDEAGYGPKLGPLVISATLWRVPGDPREVDLYRLLHPAVQPAGGAGDGVHVGDSKQLYRPGQGLAALERGVLAALAALGSAPTRWAHVWEALDPRALAALLELPWYREYACDLPLEIDGEATQKDVRTWRAASAESGCQLLAVRSRAVFPGEFNRLLGRHGGKGAVLSHLTLQLAAAVLEGRTDEPALLVCDKHGGRNRYGAVLQHQFPDRLIEVRGECRARSVYRWGDKPRNEAWFLTGGERHLPVALASMISKYLRELAMRAFNEFWQRRVPGLLPTAGYPKDASRFLAAILPALGTLKIDAGALWRNR